MGRIDTALGGSGGLDDDNTIGYKRGVLYVYNQKEQFPIWVDYIAGTDAQTSFQLYACNFSVFPDMMSVLSSSGQYHFLGTYLHSEGGLSTSVQNPEIEAYQYECAWRLGQWRQLENEGDHHSSAPNFARSHFSALCHLALVERDKLEPALDEARGSLCLKLGQGSRESTVVIYKVRINTKHARVRGLFDKFHMFQILSKLRSIKEIESFASTTTPSFDQYDKLVDKADFSRYVEPVLSQRCSLLSLPPTSTKELLEASMNYSEICRKNGLYKLALDKLASLKRLKVLNDNFT